MYDHIKSGAGLSGLMDFHCIEFHVVLLSGSPPPATRVTLQSS